MQEFCVEYLHMKQAAAQGTNLALNVATFMHRLLDTHCQPQPQLCSKRHIYCGIYRMSQKSEFQTILPQILP